MTNLPKLLPAAPTKLICRHCKVEVISRTNLKAIFGREHGKHCPRRFK